MTSKYIISSSKRKKKTQQKTKQEKRNLRNLYSRTCCHFYIFPKSSYSFCFTVSLVQYNLTKSQKKNCKSIPIHVNLLPLMNE